MLRVELSEPLTEAGLKLAVAPGGKPLALSITGPLNPYSGPTIEV
jgi:hypothetical protein